MLKFLIFSTVLEQIIQRVEYEYYTYLQIILMQLMHFKLSFRVQRIV